LLEVLPEYQKQGIGSELIRKMLEILKGMSAIDLMCDENVQPFYERFGMKKLSGMGIRR
jgi:predicted N-acetyltransferase YhbS